ncbi:MAG: sigma-E processing peptidase SpoIIGA [Clostridia bacterium]|nr:sigma-E processing peptidase SpoIIGA [Clostridia bacterium]
MVVYLDVYWLVNAAVDTVLLVAAGRLAGLRPRPLRVLAAASLGAGLAVAGELSPLLRHLRLAWMLLVSLFMLPVAFGWHGPAAFLRQAGYLYAGAAVVAGTALALPGMPASGGPGWLALLVALAAGSLALERLAWGGRRQWALARWRCELLLEEGGRALTLEALVDSGDTLVDPLSGRPAAVVAAAALEKLLGREASDFFLHWERGAKPPERLASALCWLPYQGPTEGGLLPGWRPERSEIRLDGERIETQLVVAVVPAPPAAGRGVEALVPAAALTGRRVVR